MNNSNNTGAILGALLLGALTGAAAGILLAPHKGSKTRRKLINGAQGMADDFRSKLKDEALALRQKADELEAVAKDKMHDIADGIRQKADALKSA